MVNMEKGLENNKSLQHEPDMFGFGNNTEGFHIASDHEFTYISFSLGCCIIVINIFTMWQLFRHRNCISVDGFWQQLVFLCFTDILSGVAIALPYFGYLFIAIHTDIYYAFCSIGFILFTLSITASVGHCFIISIIRYMIIKYIDTPITMLNRHGTFFMIIGNVFLCFVTFISSLMVVIIRFGFHFMEFCEKLNQPGQNEYKSNYMIGPIILLALFLLGTNILTFLCILKVRRGNRVQLNITSTSGSTSGSTSEAIRYATVTFIIIVTALDLTTVSTLIFLFVSIIKPVNISSEATELISRLITINSLCNPFIYSLRAKDFRSAVWKDIKAILPQRCTADTQ
jgi:hypothetical protein